MIRSFFFLEYYVFLTHTHMEREGEGFIKKLTVVYIKNGLTQ